MCFVKVGDLENKKNQDRKMFFKGFYKGVVAALKFFISSVLLSSLLSIIAIFITAYAFDMLSEIIYIISSSSVLFSIQTLLFSPFFILISLVVFTIKLIFILAKKKELR